MNLKEIQETAELLGVSPFDVVGAVMGDLFTTKSDGRTYEFIRVSPACKSVGVFFSLDAAGKPQGFHIRFAFTLVIPVTPYSIGETP